MMHRTFLFILIWVLFLTSCQTEIDSSPTQSVSSDTPAPKPTENEIDEFTVTPSATPETLPSLTKIIPPTPTETIQPTMTEIQCLQLEGVVTEFEIISGLLNKPFEFRVYTPPCYAFYTDQDYPVLYLLHGLGFTDDQWDRLGVDETMDRLITEGLIAPFIIVLPKDNEGTSPINDMFGEAVVKELIPHIKLSYRVLSGREFQGIGGLSRGAAWAAHLGLEYWEMFGVVGLHSLPVFYYDEWKIPIWLDAIPNEEFPRMYLDVGKRDQIEVRESAAWFTELLDERWLPYEYYLFNGTHSEEYWASHLEDYLLWYAAGWE